MNNIDFLRMRILILAFVSLTLNLNLNAQFIDIQLKLIDLQTQEPVSDAHVFVENSTFGAISDKNGEVLLSVPPTISGDLIVSHIAYETAVLPIKRLKNKNEIIDLPLNSNALNMEALVITAKRSKKWQKNFKSFQKAFLGADKRAKQCQILNPEVLKFEESEGSLFAKANDLLHIQNNFLGYEIYYLLTHFVEHEDGSVEYSGHAQFIDMNLTEDSIVIYDNRQTTYLNSPKYFYKSLIDNQLEENGFVVQEVHYNEGLFEKMADFDRENKLDGPSSSSKYTVQFEEFLKVFNQSSLELSYTSAGVRPGGLESQRFSGSIREEKAIENFDISYLYKISPYIILDSNGNVLNSSSIKEYGFWADQKMAHQLPFNYNDNIIGLKESQKSVPAKEETSVAAFDRKELNYILNALIYESNISIKLNGLDTLFTHWEDGMAAPLIELLRLSSEELLTEAIRHKLAAQYNQPKEWLFYEWTQWLWKQSFETKEYYYEFKSELYKLIDPVFGYYFKNRKPQSLIRLDEVMWGGVMQDGIPPLRFPKNIPAQEASYLDDNDVVFGVVIDGKAKAYPKRILAWHEFFVDSFGDKTIAGVYCTLCGTVIAYDMNHNDTLYNLGTSGFLYQSNKLMYDAQTQSLWSTIEGKPVMGPLVDRDIVLKTYPVVTTIWKDWKESHPNTEVLSLDTGYDRDYSEGEAYKEYFAHDRLMFPVLRQDERLKNKDEVLVVRSPGFREDPLVISSQYLLNKKWHQDSINDISILALANKFGAFKVYDVTGHVFKSFKKGILRDDKHQKWNISEEHLTSSDGIQLKRVPSHNIFWFAWYNVYPQTRLIH